jgi:tetratricopeptide (TPR) repeat protein
MHAGIGTIRFTAAAVFLLAWCVSAQPPMGQNQPDFVRQGQQLMREGKPEEALSLYQAILKTTPDSLPANNAAGIVLDWMGRGNEAREYFQKAIELAPNPLSKANAQRAMAMSWAFSGDCKQTIKYEQMVFEYYVTTKDFYQQGEIADEAARVCIDSGDLDTAYQWYLTGHSAGLKQPDITPDRKSLWAFRWEHAQARVAARKGNQTEADRHVAAAREIMAKDQEMAKTQAPFLPYLLGYVAFYRGDHETALAELQKANQNDPFIQCMMGDVYEKLGQMDKAKEYYKKAAGTTAHNPPAAYARPYARKKLAALSGGDKPQG